MDKNMNKDPLEYIPPESINTTMLEELEIIQNFILSAPLKDNPFAKDFYNLWRKDNESKRNV